MIDPRAEAVAILLGDQPGVDHAVIDAVAEEWRRTRDGIMLASYQGREGHPLIFASAFFDRLGALHGDKAAWKIVDAHRGEIRSIPLDRPHPRDVNTPEEYEALLRDGSALTLCAGAWDPARRAGSRRRG